ncbi:MAG: hypothetical protein JWP97_3894 [Labilithrix sp.]|nr:hypothetical protein [Labilithrix sp.]
MAHPLRILVLSVLVALGLASTVPACGAYESPPTVTIDGLQGGVLYDAKAPLSLHLGQPVEIATLSVKVAFYDVDLEGNLPDEDADPSNDAQLRVIIAHDALDGDRGGHTEIGADGASLKLVPDSAFPVGPKLVLLVEAGLKGTSGRTRNVRTRIPFSYTVVCTAGTRSDKLKSGVYFVLLDVAEPLGSQIQLYGAFDVDAATGAFVSQFTNADRNPDGARCGGACKSTEACRLLPAQACVIPSQRAGTDDEYPDFVPNVTPPVGYSFTVEGCAIDGDNGAGIITAPATMVVQQPAVTVEGLTMTAFFGADASGAVRATGSLVADTVRLNGNRIGAGRGNMTARLIPAGEVPAGVPPAPARTGAAADGGTDAAR